MLDRIKALIADRQLSPSQFADLTTLPRPVVSHILSGRNKPSLEAVQKIMTAFPDVSVDWLLNGRGPMVAEAAPASAQPSDAAIAATMPAARAKAPRNVRPVAAPTPEPVPKPTEPIPAATYLAAASAHEPVTPPPAATGPPVAAYAPAEAAPPTPGAALSPPPPAIVQQILRPERVVRRIMVFYSDGTFSDHRPLPADEASFF